MTLLGSALAWLPLEIEADAVAAFALCEIGSPPAAGVPGNFTLCWIPEEAPLKTSAKCDWIALRRVSSVIGLPLVIVDDGFSAAGFALRDSTGFEEAMVGAGSVRLAGVPAIAVERIDPANADGEFASAAALALPALAALRSSFMTSKLAGVFAGRGGMEASTAEMQLLFAAEMRLRSRPAMAPWVESGSRPEFPAP